MSKPRTPRTNYNIHRSHAKRRGIEWQFTFETWWQWWQIDNRWDRRGSGKDSLMMCRVADCGPYHPDNVFAGTPGDNVRDWQGRKTWMTPEEREQRRCARNEKLRLEYRKQAEERQRQYRPSGQHWERMVKISESLA